MSPLPIVRESPKIRPSRASRWRAGVLIAVHVLIALHVAHWLVAGETLTPVEPSEAIAFSRSGVINFGLIFFAATILLTAVFGRFFCGWACHLVALQDLCRWLLERVGIRPRPLGSRLLALVPGIAFVYMFLWPVAYRIWVGDRFDQTHWELTTTEFWATFPGWVIGGLTFLICGFVAVYFLGAKGFCTYACPYGAIFGVAEKLSPLRIRVTDACAGCGHCTAVCTSNVRVHEEVREYGMVVDSGCMKCMDCVSVCPNDALYYGAGPLPIGARPASGHKPRRKRLKWGDELILAGAFVAAFLSFRGLYGVVPFLMSLGLAAVLAFLVLTTVRLVRRDAYALRRFRLKRAGRLLPAGWVFVAGMVLLAGLWSHSAWLRWETRRAEAAFTAIGDLRAEVASVDSTVGNLAPDERGRVDAARRSLGRVERYGLFPTLGVATRLGWTALAGGRTVEAERWGRLAIERGEGRGYGGAQSGLAQMLARVAWADGDLARTVGYYERAIAAAPYLEAPYLNLGIALARSGRLADAEGVFARAATQMEPSSQLLYNTGLTKALLGKGDEATGWFRRCLAIDPDWIEARENLAGTLARLGRFDEAATEFREVLARGQASGAAADDQTRYLLARALLEAGRPDEAVAEVESILRRQPDWQEARSLLASAREAAERLSTATDR